MATILSAGDLAVIGVNSDNPDAFSFVLLVDIDAGTEIFFTDNGVFSDGSFRANEGVVKYTASTAVSAGTVIEFTGIGGDFTEEDAGFALSASGDQVIAYQGTADTPTFIYAAQTNSTQFQATATTSNDSALPTGLTEGTSAVAVGSGAGAGSEFDNSTYNESTTSGTRAELLAAISNAANWDGNNSRIANLADGPFTVTDAGGGGGTAPTYVEDFNNFTGSGFAPDPATGQLDSDAWSVTGLSDGDLDFGGTEASGDFARGTSTGGVSSGGVYSFEVESGNSILGVQPTGSDFTPGEFILKLQNDGDSTVTEVDVDYVIRFLNDQGRGNSLNFSFSEDGNSFTSVDGLDFVTPEAADALGWQSVDRETTITGLDIAPDETFFLKWTGNDVSGGGSRDEYGIDDIQVTNLVAFEGDGGNGGGNGDIALISSIQGSGASSSRVGEVVTIEAIVVGDFQDGSGTDGDFNGFFVQEEDSDADNDPLTSEGLFIFDGNSPSVDVNAGDLVRVTGTVAEFFGETQLSSITNVEVVSGGNSSLATPATITFPVASTTTNSDNELIADLEAFEGMLVTVPEELTVADLFTFGRFGEVGLYADGRLETFTQANEPSVSGFQAYQDLAVRNTVIIDDGSTIQNPAVIPFEVASAPGDTTGQLDANDELRSGDTTTGLTGVVRFSRGSGGSGDSNYRINPTVDPVFVNDNPRPDQSPDVGGRLTVASFNVLNFFTSLDDERSRNNNPQNAGPNNLEPRGANDLTNASDSVAPSTQAQNDPLAEFNRQVDKLVAALSETEADIFSLIELENEFGDQNGDGQFAIDFLIDELNAEISGANYQFVDPRSIDPSRTFIDTGDAISVGLIYNANTVKIADGTTIEILTDSDLAALGADPGNPVFDGSGTSRAPLAATFEEISTGETFTVAVNHFKSKGSISPFGNNEGIGDGTGNNNEARLQAAQAVDAWLDTDPTGSGDDDFLIIGDLNAYGMEDPIQFLADEGYENQVQRFLGPDELEYSFAFPIDLDTSPQVQAYGALDYALANSSLAEQVTGAREWHINADEASIFDYNLEFRPQAQADNLYADTPFRSADHDPIVLGLNLASANAAPNATDDIVATAQDTAVAIAAVDLLANDEDADGDTLTITDVSNPINGSVSLDFNSGEIVFTPEAGFSGGAASFEYTVDDGNGGEDTAVVTVNVGVTDNLGNGNNTFDGTPGNDIVNGGNGDDTLMGGEGDDTLIGFNGKDVLDGGDGNDTLDGGNADDTLNGGAGDDMLIGFNGNDELNGGDGNDSLDGGNGNDILNGGAGDDTLIGFNGNDELSGGDGNDELFGGNGNEVLDGGAGNDLMVGFNGRDELLGGAGNDDLDGGRGNDILNGGAGDEDTAIFDANQALLRSVSGTADNFTARVQGWGNDSLIGVEFIQFNDGLVATETLFA